MVDLQFGPPENDKDLNLVFLKIIKVLGNTMMKLHLSSYQNL